MVSETAIQFVLHGAAAVIVCGRRISKWNDAQNYIRYVISSQNDRDKLKYLSCDVRIESQVRDMIRSIFEEFERLDVCFNNAGVQPAFGKNVEANSHYFQPDFDFTPYLNSEVKSTSSTSSGHITNHSEDFLGSIEHATFQSVVDGDGSILYRLPPPQPEADAINQRSKSKISDGSTPHQYQSTAASPFTESPIATSCFGVMYCLKWQIHYLLRLQPVELPVSIICTCSRNGVTPDAHRPIYAASKAFVLALMKSVSNQAAQQCVKLQRAMIRVNCVSYGPIDTPLEFAAYGFSIPPRTQQQYNQYSKQASVGVPMHRTASTTEASPAVLFLADENMSSFITGANICVDGGQTGSPFICSCNSSDE